MIHLHAFILVDPATIDSDIAVEVVDTMYQFTVAASGTSPLTYTWYINNIVQDSDGPTLTVPMNFTQRHTEVKVQVTNHDGSIGETFSDNSTFVIYIQATGEYVHVL